MVDFEKLPVPDMSDAMYGPFWEGTRNSQLLVPECDSCQGAIWPPRATCTDCGHVDTTWREREATGSVYTWTVVHQPTARGFEEVPYVIGVIDLPTVGIRMLGNIIAIPIEEIREGMSVRGHFEAGESLTLLQWEPLDHSPENDMPAKHLPKLSNKRGDS